MSGLAALLAGHNPPDIYQWHSAAHVPDVQHAVEHAGWKFAYLDGWTIEDKQHFLDATASALDVPQQFTGDFDSLVDGLEDVDCGDANGVVFMWDGWSPLARHDEQAFSSALKALSHRVSAQDGGKFAVVLRGDGPPLHLPELPHKH